MIFLITILIIPFISFATAAPIPDYVNINEGDELIWDVFIDDGEYEDYLTDLGYSDEFAENYTKYIFDDELDDDIVGWKIKILEVEEEDEADDEKYVEYKYRHYIKEEDEDWKVEDQKDDRDIWKYDKDVYTDLFYAYTVAGSYGWYSGYAIPLIVADNVKWGKVAEELDDEFDDDYDRDDESAGAETATSMYFFMQKENGISSFVNDDEDHLEDFTLIVQFTDNGILLYYNYAYDGDTIVEFELQYRMVYQWWWAAALIAVAAIIIIVIILIKRR